MIVCVPVTADGHVDPRWGRAARVAIADVTDGAIAHWEEIPVAWDQLKVQGAEGAHHARVARFLLDHQVTCVAAHHMGEGMLRMLQKMGLQVRLGAVGDARQAAQSLVE